MMTSIIEHFDRQNAANVTDPLKEAVDDVLRSYGLRFENFKMRTATEDELHDSKSSVRKPSDQIIATNVYSENIFERAEGVAPQLTGPDDVILSYGPPKNLLSIFVIFTSVRVIMLF